MIIYSVTLDGQDCCNHKAVFSVLKIAKKYAKDLSANMSKSDRIYTSNVVITKYHCDMPNIEPEVLEDLINNQCQK